MNVLNVIYRKLDSIIYSADMFIIKCKSSLDTEINQANAPMDTQFFNILLECWRDNMCKMNVSSATVQHCVTNK